MGVTRAGQINKMSVFIRPGTDGPACHDGCQGVGVEGGLVTDMSHFQDNIPGLLQTCQFSDYSRVSGFPTVLYFSHQGRRKNIFNELSF